MPTDEDGLAGSPWYVRAFIRIGMPTAFAAVLLWFLLTNITGRLIEISEMEMQQAKTDAVVVANQASIIKLLVEQASATERENRFLEAVCVNAARTEADKQRCGAAWWNK